VAGFNPLFGWVGLRAVGGAVTSQMQVGLSILAVALLVFLLSRLLATQSGLPEGRLVYSDDDALQQLPKPLYDQTLNLVGKPDYVLTLKNGIIVPVEFKSQAAPSSPYDSHILQLSAYCYLCDKSFGRRPDYGLIRYANKTYQIHYDLARENEFLDVIAQIRRCEAQGDAPDRSHNQPARCRGCGYNSICVQKL
jgi:CRISPR-associated exonuclease Cas4